VVGCLVAALCARLPGVSVELVDINPARADIAARLGAGFALPGAAAGDCDLVVHASGAPAGLATALDLAGFEATILELSWYGDRLVPAPLGEAFHSRRLTLRASQVGHVAPSRRARHGRRDRLMLALTLLRDPVFDCLLTGSSAFDDLPATMAALAADPGDTLCHVVVYS
jgi:threonine dehydrogenase-like Zn-dependent dehydrogenase